MLELHPNHCARMVERGGRFSFRMRRCHRVLAPRQGHYVLSPVSQAPTLNLPRFMRYRRLDLNRHEDVMLWRCMSGEKTAVLIYASLRLVQGTWGMEEMVGKKAQRPHDPNIGNHFPLILNPPKKYGSPECPVLGQPAQKTMFRALADVFQGFLTPFAPTMGPQFCC